VQDDTLALLAAAAELPEAVLTDIWHRGSPRARCVLAGRNDLPEHITAEILAGDDGEILANWLAGERDTTLVRTVVAGRGLEVDRALAYQDALDERQKDALSWSDSPDVLRPFLLRDDLSEDQRDRALMRFVSQERILRSSYGEELINIIEAAGETDHRWRRLMEIVGPQQAALVVEAAERGVRRPPIADAVSDALRRISRDVDAGGARRGAEAQDLILVLQDLHRAARVLMRAPSVASRVYEDLAGHACMEPLAAELRRRAEIDVAGALSLLTCDGDPTHCGPGHPAVIAVLRANMAEIAMPPDVLPGAALTHADELPDGVVDDILNRLHFGHDLLEREHRAGRTGNQARLIAARPSLYDPCRPYPEEVLALLARRGARGLLGCHAPRNQRDATGARVILANYQPGHKLLNDPYYAGLVAASLLELDPEGREIAYRLIEEWQASLPDLLDFVRSV